MDNVDAGVTGAEGNGLIAAPPKMAYNDTRRVLERGFGEYPVDYTANKYQDRFLNGTIGVVPSDLRIWGSHQSWYNVPFEEAYQHLNYSDFLTLVFEEGLAASSYLSASSLISDFETLLAKYDPKIDATKIRPDGVVTFLSVRLDADYFDYDALGLNGTVSVTGNLNFNGTTETITRSSGSWIDDGFQRGDIINIANAEDSANIKDVVVFDVTATVLYCSDTNQAFTTNTDDDTAVITRANRTNVPYYIREYLRDVYEVNNASKSRFLTTATRNSINADESSYIDAAQAGKTYALYYDDDRASDDSILASSGGFSIFPNNSFATVPTPGTAIGWSNYTDFGTFGSYYTLPDPKLIAYNAENQHPSDYMALRITAEYPRAIFHQLRITSGAGGKAGGDLVIGFPYASTKRDPGTGFAFDNTADTITRNDGGSWIDEGYEIGLGVRVNGGSTGNSSATPRTITDISDTVLTCAGASFVTASGDKTVYFDAIELSGTITITDALARNKVGVWNAMEHSTGYDFTTTTITRSDGGSFVEEGFENTAGSNTLTITNAKNAANNGTFTISDVATTVITTSGLTASTDDTTAVLNTNPNADCLRLKIKTALDAMTKVPPCVVTHWNPTSDTNGANADRIVHLFFFDPNRRGEAWQYNPPYAGHKVGPDASGFTFAAGVAPSGGTITRNDGGSWVTDGFVVGGGIRVVGATTAANNGCYLVRAVTADVLTVEARYWGSQNTGEPWTQTQLQSGAVDGVDYFPLVLTNSSNDTTVLFRHTGYGVPTHATPEVSAFPPLYTSLTSGINSTSVTTTFVAADHDDDFGDGTGNAPVYEWDWLDDDFNVVDLGGKTVPVPTQQHQKEWSLNYFTKWFEEYRDNGGPDIDVVFHDHEPTHTPYLRINNLRTGTNAFIFGGAQSVEGNAAATNYVKYLVSRDDWDDSYTLVSPSLKTQAEINATVPATNNQLETDLNARMQVACTKYKISSQRTRGFIEALQAVYPNAAGFGPHKSIMSSDIQYHEPYNYSTYYGTFGTVEAGNMESFFSLFHADAQPEWQQQIYTQPATTSDNAWSAMPVRIESIQRANLITTVTTADRDEIRTDARKGNFQAFNDYYVGQYIRIRENSSTTGLTGFDEGNGGGATSAQYAIYKPILSVAAADGNGMSTSITYQDYYFKDAVNGISLGTGGASGAAAARIVRLDGKNWQNEGWIVGESVTVSNATNAAHNGTYVISSFSTTTMVLTTSPFGTPQAADTAVRINKASTALISPDWSGNSGDNFDIAEVVPSTCWDQFLWTCEFLRSTFKSNKYPVAILKNTYGMFEKAKYVTYGGELGPLVDNSLVDYLAEIFFHMKMHNAYNWIFSGTSTPTNYPDNVLRAEEIANSAMANIYEVCPYRSVKPLSLNSLKPVRTTSEYIVSGCIMPNNRRLFRTTIKLDPPQDLTCPGAVAPSTHTPGVVAQKNGYVIFQTRFGVQFNVPGNLQTTDDFNTTGWWTIS